MKKNFLSYLFPLICLPILAKSAIYQKIDDNGMVYFSDMLTENAVPLRLKPVNVYFFDQKSTIQENKKAGIAKNNYKKFSISSPNDEENFQNQYEISATLQIEPHLSVGDKILWLLDGKKYQESNDHHITLKSLTRGEHILQAKLFDSNNKELMVTQNVVFYVHYAMMDDPS